MIYIIYFPKRNHYFGDKAKFDTLKNIKEQLISYYEDKELEPLNLKQIAQIKHIEIQDINKTKIEEITLEKIV